MSLYPMKLKEKFAHPKDSVGTRIYSKNNRKGTITSFVNTYNVDVKKPEWLWDNDDWDLWVHWDGDREPNTLSYVCWMQDMEVVEDESKEFTYPKEENNG